MSEDVFELVVKEIEKRHDALANSIIALEWAKTKGATSPYFADEDLYVTFRFTMSDFWILHVDSTNVGDNFFIERSDDRWKSISKTSYKIRFDNKESVIKGLDNAYNEYIMKTVLK